MPRGQGGIQELEPDAESGRDLAVLKERRYEVGVPHSRTSLSSVHPTHIYGVPLT